MVEADSLGGLPGADVVGVAMPADGAEAVREGVVYCCCGGDGGESFLAVGGRGVDADFTFVAADAIGDGP